MFDHLEQTLKLKEISSTIFTKYLQNRTATVLFQKLMCLFFLFLNADFKGTQLRSKSLKKKFEFLTMITWVTK
jgi:hypothetical protein